MAIEITMPALSPTMEEGTLAKWHVKEGDSVASGDVLAEIETDKATMEVESIDDGVIAKLFVNEGSENVAVGTVIALLAEEDEDADTIDISKPSQPTAAKPSSEPDETVKDIQVTARKTAAEQTIAPQAEVPNAAVERKDGSRIIASPLAKRLAKEKGIDLRTISGSGPRGRIVKADIVSAPAATGSSPAVSASATDAPRAMPEMSMGHAGPASEFEEIKLSSMRKVIAKRLTESKQSVPHFYLSMDANIDALLKLRQQINSQLEDGKVSVNDFIVKASALALKAVPNANVQYGGDVMRHYKHADISVAVATDGGLITPVVRSAELKGLKAISDEVKDLAARAKEGKLLPEEYQGGTFSISNLGMYGIDNFAAVINPPQGSILAVGQGIQKPVVIDGVVSTATVMTMTLSCDHRAIDGAVGAEFLAAIKRYLENPLTIML